MSKTAEHLLFKPHVTQNGTLRISAWDALHLTARYGASHPETRSRPRFVPDGNLNQRFGARKCLHGETRGGHRQEGDGR